MAKRRVDPPATSRSWLRWAAPLAVLVLATGGYFLVVPLQARHPALLRRLIVAGPGIAGYAAKPVQSLEVLPADTSYGAEQTAGQKQPDKTGTWQVIWRSANTRSLSEMQVEVDLLPDAATAAAVYRQMEPINLGAKAATPLVRQGTFTLPGISGAGATFSRSGKGVTPTSLSNVILRVGRADARIVLQQSAASRVPAVAVARREAALLQRAEPGFVLSSTAWPPLASALWWLVAVLLAAATVIGPRLRAAAVARRRAHQEAVLRYQYQARGKKVLKRRGKSPLPSARRRGARR